MEQQELRGFFINGTDIGIKIILRKKKAKFIYPFPGCYTFVADYADFCLADSFIEKVKVVGIESIRLFRMINYCPSVFAGLRKALFVTDPLHTGDVKRWLKMKEQANVQYVHVGNLDLEGLYRYQREYFVDTFGGVENNAAERVSFFIPSDWENRIKNGNAERFNEQWRKTKYKNIQVTDKRIKKVLECILDNKKVCDQDSYQFK